jgi:hypothetical protein
MLACGVPDPRLLATLPAVHVLVDAATAAAAIPDGVPRWAVVEAARRAVANRRAAILAGKASDAAIDPAEVARLATDLARPPRRRLVKPTRVVVQTKILL